MKNIFRYIKFLLKNMFKDFNEIVIVIIAIITIFTILLIIVLGLGLLVTDVFKYVPKNSDGAIPDWWTSRISSGMALLSLLIIVGVIIYGIYSVILSLINLIKKTNKDFRNKE